MYAKYHSAPVVRSLVPIFVAVIFTSESTMPSLSRSETPTRLTQYSQPPDCTAPSFARTRRNVTVTRGQVRSFGWTVVLAALNGIVNVAFAQSKFRWHRRGTCAGR